MAGRSGIKVGGIKAASVTVRQMAQAPRQALGRVVEDVEDYVEQQASRHSKGGPLGRSISKRRIADGWEVYHDRQAAPHAMFVHWGTKPHVIRGKPITPRKVFPKAPNKVFGGIFRPWYVKTRKTLRWAIGGRFVYADSVKHPGYKGDPWMARAAVKARELFNTYLARFIKP